MTRHNEIFYVIFIIFLLSNVIVSLNIKGCKDIVAVGDATDGNYNLLLKVRDPSRPGPQVLCIVPEGYEYTYNHPWTGKPMEFKTKHKFIGVATKGDTIPNIVKAGTTLTDSGIAFGDADTDSNWKNPTRNAWDDFDWIRYACEKADDENQAVNLMTEDCVDQLHASGVSENLFVVGPKKAFVIEADAFHYNVKEINDIVVMSNYPKELWRTQRHKKLPIASSFDMEKEGYVRRGRTVRLNSLYGVKIVGIGEDWIVARQVPFVKIYNKMIRIIGTRVEIKLGERETVGDYSVRLIDIDGKTAKISVSYVFKAWEDKMLQYIESKHGCITLKDMINWSRLHGEDLEGLRPMCQDSFPYESVMIYKIPEENYGLLSSGWFSASHACSSIYVPVHISNNDIYEPYKTEQAAEVSLELLDLYGHGTLTPVFSRVEDVFLSETEGHEEMANKLIENNSDISEFLTIADTSIQEQAWLTEQIWLEVGKSSNNKQEIIEIIGSIWRENYSVSLDLMTSAIDSLRNISESRTISKITDIALNVCESRLNAAQAIGKNISTSYEEYKNGKKLIEQGDYSSGFQLIKNAFRASDMLLKGKLFSENTFQEENEGNEIPLGIGFIIIVFIAAMFLLFI
ncbi:hypothetical protein MBGDF03_00213 [Thermoplasmatales archaeon SCGC AB-540-F20]|nr:hypothetical protein MBGDF03_00213 [Thermoplasmatales archaeon SCGC AB-540-F20]